ncbi:hypothetical protein ABPG77_002942 [Micractinium sp. CCAP 211/92]
MSTEHLRENQEGCVLCESQSSSSWRKKIVPGSSVCNACACFLYRRVRSGRPSVGHGASIARAVSSLARKLLAGRSSLCPKTDVLSGRLSSRASSLARAARGRGLPSSGSASSNDERPGRERHHERRKLGRAAPPQVQLDVQHAVPTQGQQAQQLLDDLLHQLGWAAGQREEADREEEAEAQRCQLACERVWRREQRRLAAMGRVQRKDPREQAQEQGSSAGTPCPAAQQRRAVQGGCPAPGPGLTSAASGSGMDWLREAAWQAAHDPEAATQALLTAWRSASIQPGFDPRSGTPTPLGAAPAIWLLLPHSAPDAVPLPAGVLLLGIHPPEPRSPGCSQLSRPCLRLLVYCRHDGSLLQLWGGAVGLEALMTPHPRFGLPCWDSG